MGSGVTFEVTVLLLSSSILLADAINAPVRTVTVVLALLGALPASLRLTDVFMLDKVQSPSVYGIVTLGLYVGVVGILLVVAFFRGRRPKKE
jgi:hypothetical protein